MKKTQARRLRIAMLGHKRIPSREGGVEIVVEELSTRMAALGHSVTCYNRGGHHVSGRQYDALKLPAYKNVRLKTLPALPLRGFAAMSASLFGAAITAFSRYDVVHFHAEGSALMCWLPRLLGKKVIVTVHGLDWQRAKWGRLASAYIRMGEKSAARHAHEIIVLSRDVQKYFRDTYGRETRLIPNGVTRPQIVPANEITRQFGLGKNGYVLYLSRLVPEKGLQYLIEAFKGVKTEKQLVIAGGASDTDAFAEEMKTLAAGDARIRFTGFVQGQLLQELYSNACVYVLPSDLEGMPLSLLEAMSYGNCCLTSDISECTDVTEGHALSFKKGDTADLCAKLQFLLDHPETIDLYKSTAASFICEKYVWDDIAAQTLALYRK